MNPISLPVPLPSRIVGDGDLVIRRWAAADAEPMGDMIVENLAHLRPWMAWARDEPVSAEARHRLFEHWDRYWASGMGAVYAIDTADGPVGGCSLHRRIGPGVLEVGYWLGRSSTGRGIATRAARALTTAAFALDDIDVVRINHAASNTASGGVAGRLGFVDVSDDDHPAVTTWERRRAVTPTPS